jgi:flagellar assembly protein FliH
MSTSATSKGVKFTFDTHFGGEVPEALPGRNEARSRRTYSAEEIEFMREQAHAEGMQSGEVRAKQALVASIAQISAAIMRVIQAMDADVEEVRKKATQFAMAAARHLAGAALDAAPQKEIEAVLREAAHQAIGEPRIVLRLAPQAADALAEEAASLAHLEGFEGRVQVVADRNFTGADCRVEWRGGGIERLQEILETHLADLVAQRFSLGGAILPLEEKE